MKNILKIDIGYGVVDKVPTRERLLEGDAIYLIDIYFKNNHLLSKLPIKDTDFVHFVDSDDELTTTYVNTILDEVQTTGSQYKTVVGVGGGTSLDFAKAISNLLNNPGRAEEYQGWDLVKNPGVYKIGIPTLSGTGAEASRTCVMINPVNGLKLGMNSDYTIYDELIMDPSLTKTVPENQYFYTGMDTYVHCIESLNGSYRHALSDAYSIQALSLVKSVFMDGDMMSDINRERLMVASYFGGTAIANSFVGVIHPLSAGLSVVLGVHHGEANCITMMAMEEFYPEEYKEFMGLVDRNEVHIKRGICQNLTEEQYDNLYKFSIMHEIPLKNALGTNFKEILTKSKVIDLFLKM